MSLNFCPMCGTSLAGQGSMNFCTKCGAKLSFSSSPSGGLSYGGMTGISVEFPSQPAKVGGMFSYFGVSVDGRDMRENARLGQTLYLDVGRGVHEITVRQVNTAVFGGIAKASVRLEVFGGEKLIVRTEGKNLTVSCTGNGVLPETPGGPDSGLSIR